MAFIALERLINFHEGYRRVFTVNHQHILLVKSSGKSYAIQALCPHKHWPLLEAEIAGDIITCPQHHAEFCLLTGKHLSSCQMSSKPLQVKSVAFEGIYVGING